MICLFGWDSKSRGKKTTCCHLGYKMFTILKSLQIATSDLLVRTGKCLSLMCLTDDALRTIWSPLVEHQLGYPGVMHPHPSSDR